MKKKLIIIASLFIVVTLLALIKVNYKSINIIRGYSGGFSSGYKHYEINCDTKEVFIGSSKKKEYMQLVRVASDEEINKLIDKLQDIEVLNWKRKYVDTSVLDGTQWEAQFIGLGRDKKSYGSNDFPDKWKEYKAAIKAITGE